MDEDQTEPANAQNLVARRYEILQSLPLRYRWEFMRRHPCYVMCWNNVAPGVAPSSSEHPGESELRLQMAQYAKRALYTIGFTGVPVAPASDSSDLAPDALAGIWTKGAAARVRFGTLAAMLVKILPRDAKRAFAAALETSAVLDTVDDNRAKAQKECELYERLAHGELPDGDSHLPELLVTLNSTASRRDATEAIV